MTTNSDSVDPKLEMLKKLVDLFSYSIEGTVTLQAPTEEQPVYWVKWEHTIEKDGVLKPVLFNTAFREEDLEPEVFDPVLVLTEMRAIYTERIEDRPDPANLVNIDPTRYSMLSILPDSVFARIEKEANILLTIDGHVFLNQIYRDLGLPETPAGQIVGWKWKGGPGHIRLVQKQLVPNNPMRQLVIETDGVIVHLI